MNVLEILWQLPQSIIGGIFYLYFRVTNKIEMIHIQNGIRLVWINNTRFTGISLGYFCFLHIGYQDSDMEHEYGHSIQSLFFGPLYLIIIGLPSLTMNILTRLKTLKAANYYKRWPENWADKLAGVKRK